MISAELGGDVLGAILNGLVRVCVAITLLGGKISPCVRRLEVKFNMEIIALKTRRQVGRNGYTNISCGTLSCPRMTCTPIT